MKSRAGFTLPEVLIASSILTIALLSMGMMMSHALKKASAPNVAEQAALLANERLDYFRAQPFPFNAVGGTYFQPPQNPQASPANSAAPYHNTVLNLKPGLFVREFLYEATEGQPAGLGGQDLGMRNQGRDLVAGKTYARNEIPPTNSNAGNVMEVVPYVDVNTTTPAPAPTPSLPDGSQFVAMVAPRANADVLKGSPLDPSIQFVREVWVQTNHPSFAAGSGDTGNTPYLTAAQLPMYAPAPAVNLPPYTVSVTVRVYPRDPLTKEYDPTMHMPTAPVPGHTPSPWRTTDPGTGLQAGPGYDVRFKPLAEVTGYFGLQRNF